MDPALLKFKDATRALKTLKEALQLPFSKIARDATIQRFEYTTELFWKFLKVYLRDHEGVDTRSPKETFRKAFSTAIITERECRLLLRMIDDRNMTVHTYIEAIAHRIYRKISRYSKTMQSVVSRLRSKLP